MIGINGSIISQSGGYEGIGFAIPIKIAKRVVPDLIQLGHYDHPQLGVTTIGLSLIGQAARQQLGLPANQRGLLVQGVTGGAVQAGIQASSRTVTLSGVQLRIGGDIIVSWMVNRSQPAGNCVRISKTTSGQATQSTCPLFATASCSS